LFSGILGIVEELPPKIPPEEVELGLGSSLGIKKGASLAGIKALLGGELTVPEEKVSLLRFSFPKRSPISDLT
jgi:hypothetical protein